MLGRWGQAYPSSILLPVVKAGFHLDSAWKWRGNSYADKVTPEGWEGFRKELARAREILEASPSSKVFPEYYSHLLADAIGQDWPRERFERLFAEAVGHESDYDEFYCEKARYLLPRWHGRAGEWEQFAEEERLRHGAGAAGDALYARIALSMRGYYEHLFTDSAISWDRVASGYEYLIRQYPDSRYLKSFYANLAWKVGDRVRLRQALPGIKAEPDMTVWVNLENVALAEKFAAGEGGR